MKHFFQSTYYFWIITKFVFAILAFISAIGILGTHHLTVTEKMANYVGIIYALLLILDMILSLNGNYSKFLKYTTGSISIMLGIIIFVLLINVKVISIPVTVIFVIWIILLGLFDLLIIKKKSNH